MKVPVVPGPQRGTVEPWNTLEIHAAHLRPGDVLLGCRGMEQGEVSVDHWCDPMVVVEVTRHHVSQHLTIRMLQGDGTLTQIYLHPKLACFTLEPDPEDEPEDEEQE